jgi:hypothetical protein
MLLFTIKWIIKQLIKEMCGLSKCCYVSTAAITASKSTPI